MMTYWLMVTNTTSLVTPGGRAAAHSFIVLVLKRRGMSCTIITGEGFRCVPGSKSKATVSMLEGGAGGRQGVRG
jgi:hypothetical protein